MTTYCIIPIYAKEELYIHKSIRRLILVWNHRTGPSIFSLPVEMPVDRIKNLRNNKKKIEGEKFAIPWNLYVLGRAHLSKTFSNKILKRTKKSLKIKARCKPNEESFKRTVQKPEEIAKKTKTKAKVDFLEKCVWIYDFNFFSATTKDLRMSFRSLMSSLFTFSFASFESNSDLLTVQKIFLPSGRIALIPWKSIR